jgi:SEC-C motif
MKPRFNQPCPCNSGKKYKNCHYLKEDRSALSGWANVSVLDRNRMLIRAAEGIFGFRKGRTWAEFKRDIADEEIREFFKVHGSMWGPETNWVGIMPTPGDGKLRGLYLGDVRPDLILRNLIRFSLYNDQLLVIDPFPNARNIKPKYNPIENPGQYKAEMVKLIYFLFVIAPWIETGVVQLIPDPGDIDRKLRFETADLARARLSDIEPDAADLADTHEVGRDVIKRFLFALDEQTILRQVERSGRVLSEAQKRQCIEYARRELREDPIAWERPTGDNAATGQLSMVRSGVNLETALLISDITGAFPYTNMRSRWRELVGARDEMSETARIWSPLANTFQSLEFKFLNKVDVGFATRIREDGRLESFRSLLRTIGKQASDVSSIAALDSFVRDSKDALIGEHKKATAEWDKIQESFVKWAGSGLTAATTGLMTGHMAIDAAALSGAVLNTISQLGLRHMRKTSFRKSNPMSVFIDLSEKEPRGTTIY